MQHLQKVVRLGLVNLSGVAGGGTRTCTVRTRLTLLIISVLSMPLSDLELELFGM